MTRGTWPVAADGVVQIAPEKEGGVSNKKEGSISTDPTRQWKIQIKWEPRDLWVGLYWTRERNERNLWALYLCLVPCFPIVIKQYVRY